MARAFDTYRGERRQRWKGEKGRAQWSAYTLPSKPLSKRSLARREEWSRKQIEMTKDWVTAIQAKLYKRFVLSNRELSVFLMSHDANPAAIDTSKS